VKLTRVVVGVKLVLVIAPALSVTPADDHVSVLLAQVRAVVPTVTAPAAMVYGEKVPVVGPEVGSL
jgi:hypothetical protein